MLGAMGIAVWIAREGRNMTAGAAELTVDDVMSTVRSLMSCGSSVRPREELLHHTCVC